LQAWWSPQIAGSKTADIIRLRPSLRQNKSSDSERRTPDADQAARAKRVAVGGAIILADPNEIAFGVTPGLKILLAVAQLCAVLTALTLLGNPIAW
jgi:hypothetical protein